MDHHTAFRFHLAITLTGILGLGLAGIAPAEAREPAGAPAGQGRVIGFDERVACERLIADVYWRHRIWPEENRASKPQVPPGTSEADLARRVRDTLSKSSALGSLWKRPISAEQLRAEIMHMARRTRDARMLGELWDALRNDSTLVGECLARPALADRLIRNWYSFDDRFHGELRERVRSELDAHGTVGGMRAMSGRYGEQVWQSTGLQDGGGRRQEKPGVRVLDEESWISEMARLQSLFGLDGERSERGAIGPPAGTLSPMQEDENGFHVLAVIERRPGRITLATVTWPKRSFDEWWRENAQAFPATPPSESLEAEPLPAIVPPGCADDTWGATPFAPKGRDMHAMVWTGAELLIWGGDFVEGENVPGGRYDPATDTWRPISTISQPTMRQLTTAVWTGSEMLVWGGWGGGTSENVKNTGGRYDPMSDSWTPISISGAVPSARVYHTAVWTGGEMIVWGGCATIGCFTTLDTGGRYDPATDSWRPVTNSGAPPSRRLHTAVWTGSRMIVWGGERPGMIFRDGARYNPAIDAWSATTLAGSPEARSLHTAVWTGTEMIVWGGCRSSACFYPLLDTGGRYDPATDAWRPISVTGSPYQRRHHTAVWTGSEMIIWGGCADTECNDFRDSGGRYSPQTDTWAPTNTTTDPGARAMHTAVWTGTEMIIWGGCLGGECTIELAGGGRYSPASDSWVPIGAGGSPLGRIYHTAIWTGTEMIVWGGTASSPMQDGRRYDAATDRWAPVTTTGAPEARAWHSAVWTGTEMIVWGGALQFGGPTSSGGRYDPATDSWRLTSTGGAPEARNSHTAVWTGEEMIVWGGMGSAALATGGRYNPATDSWSATSTAGAPSGRFAHTSVWTSGEMIVWGGGPDFLLSTGTGGRYSPATNTWMATSPMGAPGARRLHTGLWTGSEMIIWGGESGGEALGDGARYDPASDAWTPVSGLSAPAPRRNHSAVWTGEQMIVWGGEDGGTLHRTGGRYDPAGDRWNPTSVGPFVPTDRTLHTAVWTGTEAIVWGGRASNGYTDTGARYCDSGSGSSSWPGSVSQLTLANEGGMLQLVWNPSCSGGATDYAIYQGTIGNWTSHVPYLCSTGGATSASVAMIPGDSYFLIVPQDGTAEGMYGTDSSGVPRAPSAAACLSVQRAGSCP